MLNVWPGTPDCATGATLGQATSSAPDSYDGRVSGDV